MEQLYDMLLITLQVLLAIGLGFVLVLVITFIECLWDEIDYKKRGR